MDIYRVVDAGPRLKPEYSKYGLVEYVSRFIFRLAMAPIVWKTSKAKETWIFTWVTEAKIGIPPKAKTID